MVESCKCMSRLKESDRFTCGGCCRTFTKICCLHDHLKEHLLGGSYHYDNVSKTAFPKFDTVCKYAQTVEGVPESQSDGVKEKAISKRVVNTVGETLQEENIFNDIADDFKRKREGKIIRQPENTKKKSLVRNNQSKNKCKVSLSKGTLQKQQRKRALCSVDENENSLIEENSDKWTSRLNRNGECKTQNEVSKVDFTEEKTSHSIRKQLELDQLKERETEIFTNSDEEISDTITESVGSNNALRETVDSMPFKKRKISKSVGSCKIARKKRSNQSKTLCTVVYPNAEDDGADDNAEHSKTKDSDTVLKVDSIIPLCKISSLDTTDITSIDSSEISTERAEAELKEKHRHCETCGLMILKQNWNSHKRGHRRKQEFVCDKCGKAFTRSLFLNRHLITHKNIKPWRCSVCSAQFCQKKEYNLHLAGHSGHRPFICNVCDKRFLCKASLLTHQANIHMGLTHFECEMCDRRFFKKSSYTIHMATHFEAKLKCSFCERMFKDKTGLKRHEKTHTGVKRFQCHICKHGFIQSTPFWVHMEKIHGICRIKLKEKLNEVREGNKKLGIKTDILALPDGVDIEGLLTANDTEKLVKERTDQHKSVGNNLQRSVDIQQMNICEPPNLLKSDLTSLTKVPHSNNNSDLNYRLRKNFRMSHDSGDPRLRSELPPSDQASSFPSVRASILPSIKASLRPELSVNVPNSLEPSLETSFIPGHVAFVKSDLAPSVQSSFLSSLQDSMKASLRSELPPSIQASVVPSVKAFLRSELPPRVQAGILPSVQASPRSNLPSSVEVSLMPSVQTSLESVQASVRSELPAKGQPSLVSSVQASERSELTPSLQASCVPSIESPVRTVVPPSVQASFVPIIHASLGQHQSTVSSTMLLASTTATDIQSMSTPQPLRPVYHSHKSSNALKNLLSLEPSPSLIKLSHSGNS